MRCTIVYGIILRAPLDSLKCIHWYSTVASFDSSKLATANYADFAGIKRSFVCP